mmetsp:Transcript_49271/g.157786  ORF Transcript_49271/g.157786 Transcript_49271/m.157786 type:complete len:323 (+) Transcript_49271:162-1130(+)
MSNLAVVSTVVGNIASSVCLVLTNKYVYQTLGLPYAATISAFHYLVCFILFKGASLQGFVEQKSLSGWDLVRITVVTGGSTALSNLSLQLNSVGFFQIMKLCVTPVTVTIQYVFYTQTTSMKTLYALGATLVGVGIATVTDVELNLVGTIVACMSCIVTVLQHIWAGRMMKQYDMSSMQYNMAHMHTAFLMLIIIGPGVDYLATNGKFSLLQLHEDGSTAGYSFILLSCVLAAAQNWNSFLLIKLTSAVTYQVVGHLKNILVISGGFILFGYPLQYDNLSGIAVALGGVIWYTNVKLAERSKSEQKAEASSKDVEAARPLKG